MTSNIDVVLFWGHGNANELWFDSGNAINKGFTVGDINAIYSMRKILGQGKFKCIEIDECEVYANVNLRNALLKIADKVIGYEGETFAEDWPHSPGVMRVYTRQSPVPPTHGGRLPTNVPRNYKKKT